MDIRQHRAVIPEREETNKVNIKIVHLALWREIPMNLGKKSQENLGKKIPGETQRSASVEEKELGVERKWLFQVDYISQGRLPEMRELPRERTPEINSKSPGVIHQALISTFVRKLSEARETVTQKKQRE